MKINFKRESDMTLLNKIKTRYMLLVILVSFSSMVTAAEAKGVATWGASARQGKRPTMQDQWVAETNHGEELFFAVLDGHGGTATVDCAKKDLYKNFFESEAKTTAEKLKNAFLKTDENFLEYDQFKEDESGTTAVVVVLNSVDGKLVFANCGDSRGILLDSDCRVLFATEDHKPDLPGERERIEAAGGKLIDSAFLNWTTDKESTGVRIRSLNSSFYVKSASSEYWLAMSRAIGNRSMKKRNDDGISAVISDPDVYEKNMEKGNVLILASDGLWDVMSNEEVANFVDKFNKHENLALGNLGQDTGEEVTEDGGDELLKFVAIALRDEAHKRGSNDNISVLIVELGETEQEKDTNSMMARLFKYKKAFLCLGMVAILYSLYHYGFL